MHTHMHARAYPTQVDSSRRGRGKQDVRFKGEATWISSVINLANTSMSPTAARQPCHSHA